MVGNPRGNNAMAKGLRTGPLPDREPGRHQAPPPAERVPPFVLLRQVDGDVLIAPFPRDGLSAEAAVLVKTVAQALPRDLPAGCFWVDPRDGRATRRRSPCRNFGASCSTALRSTCGNPQF